MFECHSCLLRNLRALTKDIAPLPWSTPIFRPIFQRPLPKTRTLRRYSEVVTFRPKGTRKDGLFLDRARKPHAEVARRPPQKPPVDIKPRNLREELKYIGSPMRLADHIRDILRKGEDAKAYELLKLGSREMQCIVGWNHLIDFHMSKENIKGALKIYNDMKKRAQRPDSYTYLIMLRGFAHNAKRRQSVNEAVKLYHSMSGPTSRVKPTIMHTNAVLNVTARAGDMDALWSVAGTIPSNGPGAADYTTYTTILNALRQDVLARRPHDSTPEQEARRIAPVVNDGRRIWMEIVSKWRSGDLFIDESLVCAMGRLLLIGHHRRDWDDVLSLVEQTMRIERLLPRYGDTPPQTADIAAPSETTTEESTSEATSEDQPQTDADKEGHEFDPVKLKERKEKNSTKSISAYVQPSNNTLSLLLEALAKLESKRTARQYWDVLTSTITPDDDNFHQLLRHLRRARASAEALEIMRTQMTNIPLSPKTFRIAMSTCVRDKNNQNVLTTAAAMIDLMANRLPSPDIKVLSAYLELVLHAGTQSDVMRALDRINPRFIDLKSLLVKHTEEGRPDEEEQDNAAELARMMVAGCDRLLKGKEIPEDRRHHYMMQRNKLTSFASQHDRSRWVGPKKRRDNDEGVNATEEMNERRRGRPDKGKVMDLKDVRLLRAEKRRDRRFKEKVAIMRRGQEARKQDNERLEKHLR